MCSMSMFTVNLSGALGQSNLTAVIRFLDNAGLLVTPNGFWTCYYDRGLDGEEDRKYVKCSSSEISIDLGSAIKMVGRNDDFEVMYRVPDGTAGGNYTVECRIVNGDGNLVGVVLSLGTLSIQPDQRGSIPFTIAYIRR